MMPQGEEEEKKKRKNEFNISFRVSCANREIEICGMIHEFNGINGKISISFHQNNIRSRHQIISFLPRNNKNRISVNTQLRCFEIQNSPKS